MRVVKLRVFLSLMISLAFFPPWNVKWTIFFLWIVISAVALTLDSMKRAVNILFSWWTVIFITLYVVSLSLFCLFLNTHYNMYIINFMTLGDHDRTFDSCCTNMVWSVIQCLCQPSISLSVSSIYYYFYHTVGIVSRIHARWPRQSTCKKLVCVLPNITVLIYKKKTLIDNENIICKK